MAETESLESFFHDQVELALRKQHLEADALTEFYLVQLLAAYATQPLDDGPLGTKLLEALGATPAIRRQRLREVGDTSLVLSGFWPDSLSRRIVDVDYYIDLGGSAYGELARAGEGWVRDPYGDVYGRLAENFARFVEVLALIAQWLLPGTPQDIIKLYDQYRESGSAWAARRLAALGVVLPAGGAKAQ